MQQRAPFHQPIVLLPGRHPAPGFFMSAYKALCIFCNLLTLSADEKQPKGDRYVLLQQHGC